MAAIIKKTVGELTAELPGAAKVFESYGIDYCCGGKQQLEQACAGKGISAEAVVAALARAQRDAQERAEFVNWQDEPLDKLIDHILNVHHVYTRETLQRIEALLTKVLAKHSDNHPELKLVGALFSQLQADLTPHMQKEEIVLFPYIKGLLRAVAGHGSKPQACFPTVMNPIKVMNNEHEVAGALLVELRKVTTDYLPPQDACNSFRVLYQTLQELEQDLHMHIHLESNLLFPRALELEGFAAAAAR